MPSGGRKQHQHASSATYTVALAACPSFSSSCSNLQKIAKVFLGIKIVGNFCTLLHLDCVSKKPMVEYDPKQI